MDGYISMTGLIDRINDDDTVRSHKSSDWFPKLLVLIGACLMWTAGCVGAALLIAGVMLPWLVGY